MSEIKFEKKEKPAELIRAERLIDDGKYDEVLQIMKNFEENKEHTLHDIVLCHLLKGKLLLQQGLYNKTTELAEKTYEESLGLGASLLSVDTLLLMAEALIKFMKLEEGLEIIKQGEKLLKHLTQEIPQDYKQRKAYLTYLKGSYYWNKDSTDQALKHFEHSLALREELDITHEIAQSLYKIAFIFDCWKGELDRGFKYAERSVALAKKSAKKYYISHSLLITAVLHHLKGEIDRSIKFNKQSLTISKEINDKEGIVSVLHNLGDVYRTKGDFNRALECIEQSLEMNYDMGDLKWAARNHIILIQTLIEKGDIDQAKLYLQHLEGMSDQLANDKTLYLFYLFDKALLLKTSSRTLNRGKAEELLRQILEDEDADYPHLIRVLPNLCELLLIELRMTNNLEVLEAIEDLVAQLLDIAEKSHSFSLLCETFLLKAKLSLIVFDIKNAKRFLTQARQVAERLGFSRLVTKITHEYEDLLKKLNLWEKLKEVDASVSDRMELARLDEKIVRIIQKHPVLLVQVSEEKVAISKEKKICLVCRGEVFGFSYACKCGANYCENCARALTDLENVCWACDVPIDYSKPVKPYKKEEERVKVEDKVKNIKKK